MLPPPEESSSTSAQYLPAIAIGLGCALLHAAIATGAVRGLLIGFAPPLLLLGLGFVRGTRMAGIAIFAATVALLLLAPQSAPLFLAADGLPVLLMLRLSLTYFAFSSGRPSLSRPDEKRGLHLMAAFSTGQVLTGLSLYAASLLLLALLMLASGSSSVPLPEPAALTQEIARLFTPHLRDGMTEATLAERMLPMLPWFFGVALWGWVLSIWGMAALARFMAEAFFTPAPRSLALTPFHVPWWMMPILGLLALAGYFLTGWLAIGTHAIFCLLLLPYFLSGLSQVWPSLPKGAARRWIMALILLGLLLFPWAALIFIAIGFVHPLQSRSRKS